GLFNSAIRRPVPSSKKNIKVAFLVSELQSGSAVKSGSSMLNAPSASTGALANAEAKWKRPEPRRTCSPNVQHTSLPPAGSAVLTELQLFRAVLSSAASRTGSQPGECWWRDHQR